MNTLCDDVRHFCAHTEYKSLNIISVNKVVNMHIAWPVLSFLNYYGFWGNSTGMIFMLPSHNMGSKVDIYELKI
jgi:hypothetical protein